LAGLEVDPPGAQSGKDFGREFGHLAVEVGAPRDEVRSGDRGLHRHAPVDRRDQGFRHIDQDRIAAG